MKAIGTIWTEVVNEIFLVTFEIVDMTHTYIKYTVINIELYTDY